MKDFLREQLFVVGKAKRIATESGRAEMVTEPFTDLWQRTYYGFRRSDAALLLTKTKEPFFSFEVKTAFESKRRFDQCGIALYLDEDNWLKASVEYENDVFQRLGSVVTNGGYSDWATTDIPADIRQMWYRLSRRESDFCIEYSADGVSFRQMRICHLTAGAGEIAFGIYACSPEDSSFRAEFGDCTITDCKWAEHR